MHSPFVVPSISPASAPIPEATTGAVAVTASPSGSGVGSKDEIQVGPFRSPALEAEWSEEQDRELAARHFVNAAADSLIRMSLGALCVRATCSACGISFLAMTRRDSLCHVCVSEAPR